MKTIYSFYVVLLLLLCSACTNEAAYILGPQYYKDVEVIVDIRPGAPRVGMNEFIIVTTHKDKRPAYEYVISIKLKNGNEWHQSIQDGHSGVYRRALRINDPANDTLIVQLALGDEAGELSFPLSRE